MVVCGSQFLSLLLSSITSRVLSFASADGPARKRARPGSIGNEAMFHDQLAAAAGGDSGRVRASADSLKRRASGAAAAAPAGEAGEDSEGGDTDREDASDRGEG